MTTAGTQVTALAQRIEEEMRNQTLFNGYIDKLQYLISNREDSELKGLREKLEAVGRSSEWSSAERDLLAFEQMLEKYTHYQSAQILFARFLLRIMKVFENKIMPADYSLSRRRVDEIIEKEIIEPTLFDIDSIGGKADLFMDEGDIYGMINWLAERCHIRWQSC
ncbi:ABC-three component system protein [Limimaricola pyoseonensis]|uniref:ABC-three component system protein n=1 Tax=Limimaricola pyoseonensis TaxID=521013 RepID=UPI00104221DB|nr:ABC-three component system protein [Limimaricola pyoseonensis]